MSILASVRTCRTTRPSDERSCPTRFSSVLFPVAGPSEINSTRSSVDGRASHSVSQSITTWLAWRSISRCSSMSDHVGSAPYIYALGMLLSVADRVGTSSKSLKKRRRVAGEIVDRNRSATGGTMSPCADGRFGNISSIHAKKCPNSALTRVRPYFRQSASVAASGLGSISKDGPRPRRGVLDVRRAK